MLAGIRGTKGRLSLDQRDAQLTGLDELVGQGRDDNGARCCGARKLGFR